MEAGSQRPDVRAGGWGPGNPNTLELYLMSHFPYKYDLCVYITLVVLRETKNIFEKNNFYFVKQNKLLEKALSKDLCENISYNQHFYFSSHSLLNIGALFTIYQNVSWDQKVIKNANQINKISHPNVFSCKISMRYATVNFQLTILKPSKSGKKIFNGSLLGITWLIS